MLITEDFRRWKAIDNPLGFVVRLSKPVIYPIITKFDEFNAEQKQNLLDIKEIIVNQIGECEMSIFGSQVNGNWDDQSDYDIIVHKLIDYKNQQYLKEYNYNVKVDMSFNIYTTNVKQIKF